jgi:hypothetical protein
MRDPLALSADKLRVQVRLKRMTAAVKPRLNHLNCVQAIVACSVCLLAASALLVVAYVYVLRFSTTALGPFAWTHWAIVGATCLLGIAAHSLNRQGELLSSLQLLGLSFNKGLPCWELLAS